MHGTLSVTPKHFNNHLFKIYVVPMTQTNHAKVYTKRKKNHIQQSFNVVIEMNGPVAKDRGCGGGGGQ